MGSNYSSKASSSNHSHDHRRSHKSQSRRRLLSILHSLNALLSFASICLFAAVLPLWTSNFNFRSGIIRSDWPDALPIGPLFLTSAASIHALAKPWLAQRFNSSDYLKGRNESTSLKIRSAKIQVYLSVTILVMLLTFLVLAGVSGLYRFWRPAVITSSVDLSSAATSSANFLSSITLHLRRSISDANPTSLTPPSSTNPTTTQKATFHSCTFANLFTRKCNPTLYIIGDLQIAAITTGSSVWLLNFILFVFQIREYQHQKRKLGRSLRAKAKAKLDWTEDDLGKVEHGLGQAKKIHYEVRRKQGGVEGVPQVRTRSSTTLDSTTPPLVVTRPHRAHTTIDHRPDRAERSDLHPAVRPKQHYYNPEITPSRSRSFRQQPEAADNPYTQSSGLGTPYGRAVEEARRKVKPAETMRDWLASRHV